MSGFSFGRIPHDPVQLAGAPLLLNHYSRTAPMPSVDRSGIDFTPILGGNDVMPDCTAVTLFNVATAASLVITRAAPVIVEAKAPRFYAATIGTPDATDTELEATGGAVVLDVLGWQAKNGCDVGQQSPLIADFGVIDKRDQTGVADAVAHLGACYIGIRVYQKDMDTVGGLWDDDGTDNGALIGLHATFIWDYAGLSDTATLRIGTWGTWQTVTWRWLMARLDEAHGLSWRQFAAPGVNYTALRADVEGFIA